MQNRRGVAQNTSASFPEGHSRFRTSSGEAAKNRPRRQRRRIPKPLFYMSKTRVLFRLQHVSYSIGDFVQFLTFGFVRVIWAKFYTETVTHITRKNVQVNMKDFLSRSLTVCEEEIYPFALDTALAQRRSKALRDAKRLRAFFLVQLCKVTCMSVGNHNRVSGINGLNV